MRFGAAFAVLVPIFLAACAGSGDSSDFKRLDVPPEGCRQDAITDDVAIANEIIGESSHDLSFDRTERDAIASRVEQTLELVRSDFPPTREMRAPPNDRWQLVLQFGPEFAQGVRDQADTTSGNLYARGTGDKDLDDLNERLGLLAMNIRWYPDTVWATACLSDLTNVPIAAEAYTNLDSIELVESSGLAGDSSRIDMRERDGTWFIVTRMADPVDPQSGCSDGPLLFLRAEDGEIEEVGQHEAMDDPMFVEVLDLVRCHSSDRWPYITPTP